MNHPPTPIAEDDQAGLSSADHAQGPEDAPITLLELIAADRIVEEIGEVREQVQI